MSITITKLKMWKNPGYTKGCLEVPPKGSKKLPAPDYTSTSNLRPRKNSTISAIELPLSFCQVFEMSYLYMEFEDNAHNSCKIFGWIDSIEQTASGEEAVLIRWTPDWWRTYSDASTFGNAVITRCNDASHKRPYAITPRKWKVKHSELLCTGLDYSATDPFWVVVTYTTTQNPPQIGTLCWRCGFSGGETVTVGGNTYYAMGIADLYEGGLSLYLDINPANVTAISIGPIPPGSVQSAYFHTHSVGGRTYYAYKVTVDMVETGSTTLVNTYTSDDMLKTVILDPMGACVYTLPWGNTIDRLMYRADSGTNGCNLAVKLYKSGGAVPSGGDQAPLGLTCVLPYINAPVNSNGWSEYVFSGQRQFDIEMKSIQREQQAVSGVISMGSNVIGGAVGGAMVGKGAGGVAGAGAGALSSIVGTYLDYEATGMFNDRYQKATDKLHSFQTSNILLSSGGITFMNTATCAGNWYIVQLEADDVSEAEYTSDITINGYETEINGGASSYITTGGPLQMRNLNITGSIPPIAKREIKTLLENGVYIVENNPSGVAP